MATQECRRSAPFRLLSISCKASARHCASADKLGNGAGNGFGLLQQQKVSRTRQVDNPDALAELPALQVAKWARNSLSKVSGRSSGKNSRAPSSTTGSFADGIVLANQYAHLIGK
jgi:hypothetical protein